MIDWDKPIETVEGRPARVISTDHRYSGETLAVIQIEHPGFSCVGYYHQSGEPAFGSVNIRNRKTKREGWVNVYPTMVEDEGRVITCIYTSEEEAKTIASKDVIATVKIEWGE